MKHVAVIDIGKTNSKATLVRAEDAAELAARTAGNKAREDGRYPHLDAARIWDFLCDALAELNKAAPVDAISVTAHGSAGAFLSGEEDGDGLALPILDYEFAGPDELDAEYCVVRPDFSESLSPRLPGGLNLGAQIFWQERRFPDAVAAARAYVNYPQYFAWRLSGVTATEMCSMGAHSDMWNPRALVWSSLVERMGWQPKLAPLRSAFDVLGTVKPALSARLGLKPETAVLCGIHDSSASLLPYLKEREPPFAVVSTGTWVILFAVGASLDGLDPARDTLANVSAYGDPVPCARFMGGREFEFLTRGETVIATEADIDRVLSKKVVALPTFAPGVGPFAARKGGWSVDPDGLTPGERDAAASLYLALMTAESLKVAGVVAGPVVVEGPFARNTVYLSALAAITGAAVEPSQAAAGTTLGALLLATGKLPAHRTEPTPVAPLVHPALGDYVTLWHRSAAGGN